MSRRTSRRTEYTLRCDQCGTLESAELRHRCCYRVATKDPVFFCGPTCLKKLLAAGVVAETDGPIFG